MTTTLELLPAGSILLHTCSYYNSLLDGVSTKQIIATSIIADYTLKMYEKAIALDNNGNLGASLLAPRLEFVKPEVKDDLYMLCEFCNAEDDDVHCRWLNLYETFEVCRFFGQNCL